MSHNIDKLTVSAPSCSSKESKQVLRNAVITGDTTCFPDDKSRERVELLTKEYEQMLAEAKAARDAAIAERDAYIAKCNAFPTFVEATDAEIDSIFDGLNIPSNNH